LERATDPLLPETRVVRDSGGLAVMPAFGWRPKASAAFHQLPRRCGERSGGFARGRASTPIRTGSARAIAPPPGSPGAATDTDRPTVAACARRAFRGTRWVARRNVLSAASSSTTPSGPARPFRLASVPRPGMTKTDIRLGTHPGPDQRGHPYARSTTSRTLLRTNAHAYTACASIARPTASPAPLRNGVA